MKNQSGPTLNSIGAFQFDSFCKEHPDITNKKAIDIILNQIRQKIDKSDRFKNIYILDGRTGSGKSTLFIAELFKTFKKKILVAEPRIVLTRNNTFDIIRRYPIFSLAKNIGFKNSNENQVPEDDHSITFMTTQLLVNQLQTYYQFYSTISELMFIIIDEAHLLDIQTLDLLREVKRFIYKHGKDRLCPLFILQSATIRVKDVSKYYFPNLYNEFRSDWKSIGHVIGLSNFKVNEQFIDESVMKSLITYETQSSTALSICSYYLRYKKQLINDFYNGSSNKFVHLIFLPYVRGILEFANTIIKTFSNETNETNENTETNEKIIKNVHLIKPNETTNNLYEWRYKNKDKRRIILVPIARGYSSTACDALIDGIDIPKDDYLESLIFIATNVIETGKTIRNLSFALDCGFDTVACFNPLMFDINKYSECIRQVPESKSKATQRLGRVGREREGDFLHFMSEKTYNLLDDYEPPDTINSYCISKQLLDIAFYAYLWKQYDFEASNIYMIKFTSDILINSCADLIRAGFLTPFSEIVDFGVINYNHEYKFLYLIRWLHYIKHYKISDAVYTAAVNERDYNNYLASDYREYKFKRIEELPEDRLTADIVLQLRKAHNTLMKIKYDISYLIIKDLEFDSS